MVVTTSQKGKKNPYLMQFQAENNVYICCKKCNNTPHKIPVQIMVEKLEICWIPMPVTQSTSDIMVDIGEVSRYIFWWYFLAPCCLVLEENDTDEFS